MLFSFDRSRVETYCFPCIARVLFLHTFSVKPRTTRQEYFSKRYTRVLNFAYYNTGNNYYSCYFITRSARVRSDEKKYYNDSRVPAIFFYCLVFTPRPRNAIFFMRYANAAITAENLKTNRGRFLLKRPR